MRATAKEEFEGARARTHDRSIDPTSGWPSFLIFLFYSVGGGGTVGIVREEGRQAGRQVGGRFLISGLNVNKYLGK